MFSSSVKRIKKGLNFAREAESNFDLAPVSHKNINLPNASRANRFSMNTNARRKSKFLLRKQKEKDQSPDY